MQRLRPTVPGEGCIGAAATLPGSRQHPQHPAALRKVAVSRRVGWQRGVCLITRCCCRQIAGQTAARVQARSHGQDGSTLARLGTGSGPREEQSGAVGAAATACRGQERAQRVLARVAEHISVSVRWGEAAMFRRGQRSMQGVVGERDARAGQLLRSEHGPITERRRVGMSQGGCGAGMSRPALSSPRGGA